MSQIAPHIKAFCNAQSAAMEEPGRRKTQIAAAMPPICSTQQLVLSECQGLQNTPHVLMEQRTPCPKKQTLCLQPTHLYTRHWQPVPTTVKQLQCNVGQADCPGQWGQAHAHVLCQEASVNATEYCILLECHYTHSALRPPAPQTCTGRMMGHAQERACRRIAIDLQTFKLQCNVHRHCIANSVIQTIARASTAAATRPSTPADAAALLDGAGVGGVTVVGMVPGVVVLLFSTAEGSREAPYAPGVDSPYAPSRLAIASASSLGCGAAVQAIRARCVKIISLLQHITAAE